MTHENLPSDLPKRYWVHVQTPDGGLADCFAAESLDEAVYEAAGAAESEGLDTRHAGYTVRPCPRDCGCRGLVAVL